MVFILKIMGKGLLPMPIHRDTIFVQHRPQKSLGMPIERFFASLRFEQRGKLDQFGIEIDSFD
jgi:hypothetical protein